MLPLLPARPVGAAATFVVNHVGDNPDLNLGDGICKAASAQPGLECTLRAAIQQANASAAGDIIEFAIPDVPFGAGDKTIRPTSGLPGITEPLTINGYTQPFSAENTLAKGTNANLEIILNGVNAGANARGLVISDGAEGSVVKGLVVNNFGRDAIRIDADGVTIQGNFIGTIVSGVAGTGNGNLGIAINAVDVVVGGARPEHRNLIAANEFGGVLVGFNAIDTLVRGNLIGTDRTGTVDVGNRIGIIVADGAANSTIGGAGGAANVIAFNDQAGVRLNPTAGIGHRISRNVIVANGELGIDLGDSGRTRNDGGSPPDADAGPNNLQNFPVLDSAATVGNVTTVRGKLRSTPGATFTLEFFANEPGADEGEKFIGQRSVTTDGGTGLAGFTFRPQRRVAPGYTVTATATDAAGNTSEFSNPEPVT